MGTAVAIGGCTQDALDKVNGPFPAGAAGAPAVDTVAPTISGQSVTPTTLRFTGGPVAITANVADNGTILRVWAEISHANGSVTYVEMTKTGAGPYSATWTAPPLPQVGGPSAVHSVRIRALDSAINRTTSDPILVTVEPPSGPEGPPI